MASSMSKDDAVAQVITLYKQWVMGAGIPVAELVRPKNNFDSHPERNYSLKNRQYVKFLQHEHQKFGINLGWTDDATNETARKVARWFFTRQGQGDGPIKYGETIALANGGSPSFIRYEHRPVGINLAWSGTPVFEWKLLGGKIGDPVYTHQEFAICNEKAKAGGECFIYFDRTAGGDIGWPSSKTWEDVFGDAVKEQLEKAYGAALKELEAAAMKTLLS
jgi:hypothetical protein